MGEGVYLAEDLAQQGSGGALEVEERALARYFAHPFIGFKLNVAFRLQGMRVKESTDRVNDGLTQDIGLFF